MNSCALCSLLFTLSFFILISHSPLQANAASSSELIANVCKHASQAYRAECMTVLKSVPEISSSENYLQLSKLLLEFALKRGIQGQEFLKQVLKKNPSSAAIAECANFCYDGVVASFRSAILELEEDPLTANYYARAAGDEPVTCNTVLAEEHINNPAIAALNREIYLLSLIAFLATNYISG